ncbi:MAG: phage tail tape measure protein [Thermodesulfobacteriota bacterium]
MFDAGSLVSKLTLDATEYFKKLGEALSKFEGLGTSIGKEMDKIQKDGQIAADKMASSWNKALKDIEKNSDMFKSIGMKISAIAAAGTAGLTATVMASSKFEASLANVSTLVNTSEVSMAKLKQGIMDLPPELGRATMLSEGLYQALSAGVKPAEAIGFVTAAAKAAKAGLTDAFTAVDAGTTILNAFGMQTSDAGIAFDQMFKTVELGKVTFEGLAVTVGNVAPTFATAKLSTEEMFAAIATLTAGGIDAARATTSLNSVVLNIIRPQENAIEVARQYGIDLSLAGLQAKGFSGFLKELQDKVGGNTEALVKIIPNIEALRAILPLVGTQANMFGEALDAIGAKSKGAIDKAFLKQMDTTKESFAALGVSVEKFAIAIGDKLAPVIRVVTERVTDMVKWFNDLNDGWKTAIGLSVALGTGLAAITGPALLLIGYLPRIAEGIAMIGTFIAAHPIGLAITGIAAAIGALTIAFLSYKAALADVTPFQEYSHNLAVVDKELERLRGRVETLEKQPWIFGPTKGMIQETLDRIKELEEKRQQIIRDFAKIGDKEEEDRKKAKEEKEKLEKEKKRIEEQEERNRRKQLKSQADDEARKERVKLNRELELSLMNEKEKAIAIMNEKVEAFRKAGLDETKIQGYIDQEKLEIEQKYTGLTQKEYDKLVEHWRQANKYKAELAGKALEEELRETDNAINQQEAMYRDLFYKSGQYAKEYTYFRELQIDIETDDLIESLTKNVRSIEEANEIILLIEQQAVEKKRQLHLETNKAMLQYSNDFVMGWSIGLDEMLAKQYTWGQAGYDVFKAFTDGAKTMFSSMFMDFFTSDLKTFGDYWESFWNSMQRKFSEILSQMLVEWMMTQGRMQYATGGGYTQTGAGGQVVQTSYGMLSGAALAGIPAGSEVAFVPLSELSQAEITAAVQQGANITTTSEGVQGLAVTKVAEAGFWQYAGTAGISYMGSNLVASLLGTEKGSAEDLATRALSGAATGAAWGTWVMPGVGTGIGAIIGGITGLLGGLFHEGGIIKAHGGLKIGSAISDMMSSVFKPREKLVLTEVGEGILPVPVMDRLGDIGFESLRSGNFEIKSERSSVSGTGNHFYIDKLVAIEGDYHVFDDRFIENLTRKVRTELQNLAELRH